MDKFIDLVMSNPIVAAVSGVIVLFILFRLYKTMRIYLGAKGYIRKSKKLRKKKFNGLLLNDKIRKKRKKNTNAYNKLKGSAKKKVKKYVTYKVEELEVAVRYSYGKLFRRSKEKLLILVTREGKTLKKIKPKKAVKTILDTMTKYTCVDEMIVFLHELTDAILEQQEFDLYCDESEVMLTYTIK